MGDKTRWVNGRKLYCVYCKTYFWDNQEYSAVTGFAPRPKTEECPNCGKSHFIEASQVRRHEVTTYALYELHGDFWYLLKQAPLPILDGWERKPGYTYIIMDPLGPMVEKSITGGQPYR
jgi:hypothetical protein